MRRPPAAAPWLLDRPYAHRGLWAPGGPPENSLAAFAAAVAAGVGVELDVRLAADGVPMVFHDASLERMTDEAGGLGRRGSAALAAIPLKPGGGERIPTLEAALAACKATPLLVEMKAEPGGEEAIARAVAAALERHPGPAAVKSFSTLALAALRAAAPGVARCYLTAGLRSEANLVTATDLVHERAAVQAAGADCLSAALPVLARLGAPLAEALGLPLLAWTARTAADLDAAFAHADGVVFENMNPALVLARRARL